MNRLFCYLRDFQSFKWEISVKFVSIFMNFYFKRKKNTLFVLIADTHLWFEKSKLRLEDFYANIMNVLRNKFYIRCVKLLYFQKDWENESECFCVLSKYNQRKNTYQFMDFFYKPFFLEIISFLFQCGTFNILFSNILPFSHLFTC